MPPQGAEQSQDSSGNSQSDRQGDALSDALWSDRRLVTLVEAWAGLPDGVKDRIAELVASIIGGPRGGETFGGERWEPRFRRARSMAGFATGGAA